MKQPLGLFILFILVSGGFIIAYNNQMDLIEGLVFWLLLTAGPYMIAWGILKKKAPFMLFFYKHHPHFQHWELLGWFVISVLFYFLVPGRIPERTGGSFSKFCALSVLAVPFNVLFWVGLMFNKRFQAWAMQEMQNIVGNTMSAQYQPAAAPDVEWKPPAPPPSSDANTFDPNRFKRD